MRIIIFSTLVTLVSCGVITHEDSIQHHEGATSYQNIHIEHFHPVPTYIRHEDKHLLEHPLSLGTSSTKVQIHHGGKHDYGFALADVEQNVHGHGLGVEGLNGHQEELGQGGEEYAALAQYQLGGDEGHLEDVQYLPSYDHEA